MANKFQKSVQQRKSSAKPSQEEAERQKEPEQSKEKKTPVKEKYSPAPSDTNVLHNFFGEEASMPWIRQAKNKTYYLDLDVIEGIEQEAKRRGVTQSRFVNEVMRNILDLH